MKSARRLILLASLASCLVLLGASPALAQTGRPGNNGTVKIDGLPFDTHPNNEPHVGCVFQVDFYGYDEGDLNATATFRLHPPTGTALLLTESAFIGEDGPGGGTDLDAQLTIDLQQALVDSGATPHPQQGFHVKLTVNAEGSIGADVKHKVFWVQCEGVYPPVVQETGAAAAADMDVTATEIRASWADTERQAMAVAVAAIALMAGLSVGTRRWLRSRHNA